MSNLQQSYDARERLSDHTLPFHLGYGNLNGDGSGIGWFANNTCADARPDTTPCTFTSVTPAWNNDNLNRLAAKLESGLIFAHVRAAYPGMPVSEQNCHPFAYGNYLFMHNGVIAGFLDIRRKLLSELRDEAYNAIQSFHSDSAVSFAVFLHHLPSMTERVPPEAILRAVQGAIAMISRIQQEHGITDTSLLNFVVSDGQTTVATRYVSNDSQPASLYFAEGSAYERVEPSENDNPEVLRTTAAVEAAAAAARAGGGETGAPAARNAAVLGEADYHLTYGGTDARVCLIASEPVTARASDWVEVPRNTALIVCREKDGLLTVMQSPLTASGEHPRHAEVYRCLEAVLGAAGITGAGSKSQLRLSASAATAAMMAVGGLGATRQYLSFRGGGYHHHQNHGASEEVLPDTPRVDTGGVSKLTRGHSTQSLDSLDNMEGNGNAQDAQHLLTGHRGAVMALCTHNDLLFSGSTDSNIKVWCLKDCKYLTTLVGHRDPLRCLCISGNTLISAGAKTVRVWNLIDFSCLAVLAASDIRGSIKAMAVTPDGKMYVGGQDCHVKLFPPDSACDVQADSPRCMTEVDTVRTVTGVATAAQLVSKSDNGHCSSITCLALFGKYLCSGSSDSTVRVWNASTLEFVKVLRGHRGSVLALHAVPGLLLSGGRDHVVRVWDADTLVCRRTLGGHSDDILHISSFEIPSMSSGGILDRNFSFEMPFTTPANPPGLGVAGSGGSASFSQQTPALAALLEPTSPRFSGKLTLFTTSSADGTIKVWSVKDLSCLHTFTTCSGGGVGGSPTKEARLLSPPAAIMSCALTSGYATGGLMNGNIAMFPVEEVYAEAERGWKQLQQRQHPGQQLVAAPNAAALAAAAAGTNGTGAVGPAPKRIHVSKEKEEEEEANAATAGRLERELEKALRIFIRIKTVSSDPSLSQDCFRGAKFLLRLLESMGAEVKLSQPVEGKNPVVLGRLGVDPSLPTVVYYGHYDVQPAMEPEWTSNPFEVSAVDGYLIARGISDNKGPTLAFIYGVKELLEERGGVDRGQGGGLPCNVVFLIEGEEENGSIGFRDAVQQNLRWFEGTEAVLISNTLWVGEKRPCITYGMRGMITFSVEVRGAAKDLHSGNEGGVFSEPLADLNKVLASLIDSRSNVSVPGFYDDVRPNMLTAALQRLQASSEFSLEGYRKALGIKELTAGRSERELLNARWCQPSLSVVDVRVGTAEDADHGHYRFGPTRFSVIPRAAVGKISCRFVPDQKAETLIDHLTTHIHHEFAKLRSGNSISVKVHSIGDWWEANPGSELMQLAEKAVSEEWKEMPLLVREGGTMPVASALEKMLDAPALLLPMGQSSDCCHLANERIRKINLIRGKNVIKRFLVAMGEKKKSSGDGNGGGAADGNGAAN